MDSIIHGAEKESGRTLCDVGVPAIQEHSNVMIPMKKDERFLVNDNEKRIE